MPWYDLHSPPGAQLDDLAQTYGLHSLHLEDVRSADERIKVDQTASYTFAIFKPAHLVPPPAGSGTDVSSVAFVPIDIFAGVHEGEPFFITVSDPKSPSSVEALARAHNDGETDNPARLLYLILDTIVDDYLPVVDHYDDRIDELEDQVVDCPDPPVLQAIFALKRELIDLRRALVNTRDATIHLQRDPNSIIDSEHQPFVRDIYDHVARLLDSVETQRDLLNNALDIYLSSVANRTNDTMKVLTVISTVALPSLAVTGIYGMNLKGLPFESSPHGATYVAALTALFTLALYVTLRRRRWL